MLSESVPYIDSHVHIYHAACLEYFRRYRVENGLDAINIASLSCQGSDPAHNLLAAAFKLQDPTIYAHAALVYPAVPIPSPLPQGWDFADQAREFAEMGFDGVKLLESKPTLHKALACPPDAPVYQAFFAYLADAGTHVIWHAADPETFWDADTAPAFSFEQGWFYGDGTFASKEQLYAEVHRVLDRHPKLNATFAHFFFLSDFPEEADRFLTRYPNISLDITPGREMYENFSRRPEFWQAFFTRYANRIYFGTDMTNSEFQGDAQALVGAMRRFLSTGDVFSYWGFEIRGLALPSAVTDAICGGNFARLCGPRPRPINREALKRYAARMLPLVCDAADRTYLEEFFARTL